MLHYCMVMLDPLYSTMNQQLFEKNLCNQSSHYENREWFPLQMEAIHKINTFSSEQRWMGHKGGHW